MRGFLPARLARRLRQENGLDLPGEGIMRNPIGESWKAPILRRDRRFESASSSGGFVALRCDETSAQCLGQVHDQVVGILNPNRNANKRRRDTHGKQGCTLDRSLRSDMCNSYFCGGLQSYMTDGEALTPQMII